MTTISNGQVLLIMGLILLAGIAFGLIGAYFSGIYPFKKRKYNLPNAKEINKRVHKLDKEVLDKLR